MAPLATRCKVYRSGSLALSRISITHMKLEDQVVSRELAMRLKELGVKQESFFVWSVANLSSMTAEVTTQMYASSIHGNGVDCSAFTVAELGEMLPREVNVPLSSGKKRKYSHRVTYSIYGNESPHGNYRVGLNHGTAIFQYSEYAGTEADARAKMLLYLLENKLISFS